MKVTKDEIGSFERYQKAFGTKEALELFERLRIRKRYKLKTWVDAVDFDKAVISTLKKAKQLRQI